MIRLIKLELYKIFSKKSLLIGIIFFIIFFGFMKYQENRLFEDASISEEHLEKFEGLLTDRKIELVEEGMKEIQQRSPKHVEEDGSVWYEYDERDYGLLNAYETVSYTQGFQERKETRINELKERADRLEENKVNNYEYRKAKLEYEMLKEVPKPGIYYGRFWWKILEFFSGSGFLIIGSIVLLGLSGVFSDEYSTKMDRLILSSKHGKKKLITSKIISSSIFILTMCVVISSINFITLFLILGNDIWNISFQSFILSNSPYNFTVLEFYGVQILFNFIGMLSFGLLVLVLSAISKYILIPFFIGAFIYLFPLIVMDNVHQQGLILENSGKLHWVEKLYKLSYVGVSRVNDLFKEFYTLNILGIPILYPYAAIVIMFILGVISTILIYFSFRRHQVKS